MGRLAGGQWTGGPLSDDRGSEGAAVGEGRTTQIEAGRVYGHEGVLPKGAADRSLPTPDGGREGIASEVAKALAALLIVEGKARLATAEESQNFRDRAAEAKAAADRLVTASKVQITVLSDADFRALKGNPKKG